MHTQKQRQKARVTGSSSRMIEVCACLSSELFRAAALSEHAPDEVSQGGEKAVITGRLEGWSIRQTALRGVRHTHRTCLHTRMRSTGIISILCLPLTRIDKNIKSVSTHSCKEHLAQLETEPKVIMKNRSRGSGDRKKRQKKEQTRRVKRWQKAGRGQKAHCKGQKCPRKGGERKESHHWLVPRSHCDPSQHQSDKTQWEEAHGGKSGVNHTFNKQTRMAMWKHIGPVLMATVQISYDPDHHNEDECHQLGGGDLYMSHWNTCCLYKSDRDDRQLLQFTPLHLQGVVSWCRGASPRLHQHYTACALDKQEQQITGHVSEFPKMGKGQNLIQNLKRHADGTFASDFTHYLDKIKAKDFVEWLASTKREGVASTSKFAEKAEKRHMPLSGT
ncbi:Glucagon-1 Glucagon I [Collichthys lucidus]|uniref:Glucagon-1 Glucagon I n=1 Tax=Collichthys lucidus TaxID=240159 RepID=A0A4U5USI7_COLLU|nr:Glucagon-1 Glucagon I [Collichthys lucidus]